jgi:hypothetical protein
MCGTQHCGPNEKSKENKFFAECDLVIPVSVSSILAIPYGHPVAAYVLFIVIPLLTCFYLPFF